MEDFLYHDQSFTEGERLIRDSVSRFVADNMLSEMMEAFEMGNFPKKWISLLAKQGLLGIRLPVELGGLGASAVEYGLICQELERVDSGLRSFVSVQNSLCIFPIWRYGSEEQKKHFLPKMAAGDLIGCFGLTEPDSGSDPAGLKTTAKKVAGGWRLNGSKLWITNASIADIAIIWTQTIDGIRGFVVEKSFPGFKSIEMHHKWALRASITGEIVLQDCFVPDSHYLPGTEKGLGTALACLTEARYGIAWGVMGAAENCYDVARDYCLQREQFGRPIAGFQLVQQKLTELFIEILKTRCFNLQIGRLKDDKKASFVMVSAAKLNACRVALHTAREARNLLGANGISLEFSIIRHLTNLEAVFTYEGTDHIHHLIVGKHITGLSAFAN
jgi:glutaryl-CoA dehydrogenase